MKRFFCFHAARGPSSPDTLEVFDEIGFEGVQVNDFRTGLAAVKGPSLTVEINSPGGDLFAALSMMNMLKSSGKEITTRVMGVAASAATIIMMAGDKREMPKNTFMMVHNAAAEAPGRGTADDHRERAAMLDKIGDSLVSLYRARTGLAEGEIKALLAKETWLTADEALAKRFATQVTPEIEARASFATARANLPAQVLAVFKHRPRAPVTTASLWDAHRKQGTKK